MKEKTIYQRFLDWQKKPFKDKKTEMKVHKCNGCGNSYKGDYCPVCGQKHDEDRASWKSIQKELQSIFGLNQPKSVISFLAQVFGRPGYLISDYISGRKYICGNPISMLGILAAGTLLVHNAASRPTSDWIKPLVEGGGAAGSILGWLASNLNWAVLIQTLLLILPTWLLFRHSPKHNKHTIPEGIYIQVFMASFVLVCIMLRDLTGDWALILIPIFYYIAYRQLFGYSVWGTFWRTLLCLGSIFYFFGVVMMAKTHYTDGFLGEMSNGAIMGLVVALLAFGAGVFYIGCRIDKKYGK